jgi:long-chain acyl-CoA synthetase
MESGEDLTYDRLWSAICACADDLKAVGVEQGSRVALVLPNRPEFTIAYFAILATGAVVVPLNPLLTLNESARLLKHAQPQLLIGDAGGLSHATESGIFPLQLQDWFKRETRGREPVSVGPARTAVIIYTSGTTGHSKGVELTHENLRRNAEWVGGSSLDGETWGGDHTILAALPLSHSFGQTCLQNAPLLHGASLVYMSRFDAEAALELIVERGVSILAAVPSMARLMLEEGLRCNISPASLRWCLIGGAPISPVLIDAFEAWSGAKVLEGYGLSETSPVCVFRTLDTPRMPGSVGRAIEGVDIGLELPSGEFAELGGPGELLVRGHAVMKGYYRDLDETERQMRDGWLRTGDVARIDERGLVYIIDRLKDVILRNGYTIYPSEVEEAVRRHEDVEDVAILATPDERVGEEVTAVVVRSCPTLTQDALLTFCEFYLAPYKRPRRVIFTDAIPKGAKGQVLRDLLVGNLDTSHPGAIY